MIVNGKTVDLNSVKTIIDLLKVYELSSEKVVIELNKEIIPRETYETTALNAEDIIEIISFVGGG